MDNPIFFMGKSSNYKFRVGHGFGHGFQNLCIHPLRFAERLAEDLLQRLKSGVANGPAGASLDLWPVQVGGKICGPGPYLQHHGGFQLVMGVPQKRWMVDFRENPTKIRMITRGSPILGNLQRCFDRL